MYVLCIKKKTSTTQLVALTPMLLMFLYILTPLSPSTNWQDLADFHKDLNMNSSVCW